MSNWFDQPDRNPDQDAVAPTTPYWDRPTPSTSPSADRSSKRDRQNELGRQFFDGVTQTAGTTERPPGGSTSTGIELPTAAEGGGQTDSRDPRHVVALVAVSLAAVAALVVALTTLRGTSADETFADDSTPAIAPPIVDVGEASVQEPTASCPDLATALDSINRATYAVLLQVDVPDDTIHLPLGTAWAIRDHLLVTNAHVTDAIGDIVESGIPISDVLAVQSGTGRVLTLTRGLTHPNYDGDPLRSPDVGLFTTLEAADAALALAGPNTEIALGDEVQVVGFPGDVTESIDIDPGRTVPQATSLTGRITARRSHDDTEAISNENLDVIQHQAPTTGGTSGSALVSCGAVIGVHNAGTHSAIVVPGDDGELVLSRTSAASNNFAVHHRHIRTMVTLFENNALQGTALPPR